MARAFKLPPLDLQKKVTQAIENTLSDLALGAQADYQVTAQTWNNKPRFTIEAQRGYRLVSTDSKIYGYVSRGTPPHVIRPRRAKALKVGIGSRAKTSPGVIASGSGRGPSSVVLRKEVNHPGIKARKFSTVIALKWAKRVKPTWARALRAALR